LVFILHEVARDLLFEELVIGFVVVEGLDDVVAVTPGIGVGDIDFFAAAFPVTSDVKPVAGPALAEAGLSRGT
jgi:hypothetical protein